MRLLVSWLFLLTASCSSARGAAPHGLRASDVSEFSALPPGYTRGELLRAACVSAPRVGGFDDAPLPSVDCSYARLTRELRAEASALSHRSIVGKRCRARGRPRPRLECSASVARPGPNVPLQPAFGVSDPGPAPSAAQVHDLDEPRPEDAAQIRVAFAPVTPDETSSRAPRPYSRVAERPRPSVGLRELGQVSARCSTCKGAALRHALRLTAAYIGAGEIAAVRCVQDGVDARCFATALVPWSS